MYVHFQFTKMYGNYIYMVIIPLLVQRSCFAGSGYRQEAAKVTYVDKQYIANLTVFTYRKSRNSPYLTSASGVSLHIWGNNLTMVLEFGNVKEKSDTYTLETRLCELFKIGWIADFVYKFSNVDPSKCPVKPGSYYFKDFELPPKNFPLPYNPNIDYQAKATFCMTTSKKKIMEFAVVLRLMPKRG